MLASGAAVATAGAGVAAGLFGYNRKNYQFDQNLHYTAFTAARSMAISQVAQYREDINDLANLTLGRMDVFHVVAAMSLTSLTAFFCPGRLGLHTPPPPEWMMGLFFINVGASYLWLGLVLWFAMHATLRAETATTHMLTRTVRLPIPTNQMLDRARKFGASYENVTFTEVFRIPFSSHYRSRGARKLNEVSAEVGEVDPSAVRRTRHGLDMPAWYRREKAIDYGYEVENITSNMPQQARGFDVPEHFEAFREIQNEWWPYDVYARICTSLAHLHLLHAWTYQQMGHHLQETRSIWAAGVVVLCISVAQQCILTLDIVPPKGTITAYRIGPFAQFFALFAMGIEYKRWWTQGAAGVGYVLVFLAYITHIFFEIILLYLCAPDMTKAPEAAEVPGRSWWPKEWHLPSSFQHTLWLVAPPRFTEKGSYDLAGEIRNLSAASDANGVGAATEAGQPAQDRRMDAKKSLGKQTVSPAWSYVQFGILATIISYLWSTLGFTVTVVNQGTKTPLLISAPGLPNNARDPRYRPMKNGAMEPVEVGTGGNTFGPAYFKAHHHAADMDDEMGMPGAHGSHRRLQKFSDANDTRQDLAQRLRELLPQLDALAKTSMKTSSKRAVATMLEPVQIPSANAPAAVAVQWPPFFEPAVIACASSGVASASSSVISLSHHGRGFVVDIEENSEGSSEFSKEVSKFVLEGVANFGGVHAATWDDSGLVLTMKTGATLECPGNGPIDGRWRCSAIASAKLPVSSGDLAARVAAVARPHGGAEGPALRAAVVFPGEDQVVHFSHTGTPGALWLPSGETRSRGSVMSASFSDEQLVLLHSDGAVTEMHTREGGVSIVLPTHGADHKHVWLSSCKLSNGNLARLALRPGASDELEPAILVG